MVMKYLLPHVLDMPMSLGDHLHELRRRLIIVIAVLVVSIIVAFSFQSWLKLLLVHPLQQAILILGPEKAKELGLPFPPTPRLLTPLALAESALLSVRVSLDAAVVVTLPVLLFQLWHFVAVGLKTSERRLGFLFIPFGVILFYLGGLLGFFWGLPYFYAWLISWQADDLTATTFQVRMHEYHDDFVNWTLCAGIIMDVPWLVMVLVRTGLVSVDAFTKWRRIIIVLNMVLAAMITPTADLGSLIAVFIPMQVLFELGLLASRVLFRKQIAERRAADAKAAAERAADELARRAEEAAQAAEDAKHEHDNYQRWHDDPVTDANADPHAAVSDPTTGDGSADHPDTAATVDDGTAASSADATDPTGPAADPQPSPADSPPSAAPSTADAPPSDLSAPADSPPPDPDPPPAR